MMLRHSIFMATRILSLYCRIQPAPTIHSLVHIYIYISIYIYLYWNVGTLDLNVNDATSLILSRLQQSHLQS